LSLSPFFLLNISGLAIGLTSFMFITLYVIHELSYDRFHKNYENIYSLKVVGRMAGGTLNQAVTTALVRPRSMILTEEYAKKYFSNQDPMGQKMIVEADTILYTVTGVVQNVPDNSHIKFDMLASMSTYPDRANNENWVSHNFYTYIVVKDVLQAK
jgi:MacB-like periplasmic core domain